jgi:hypothetical protein
MSLLWRANFVRSKSQLDETVANASLWPMFELSPNALKIKPTMTATKELMPKDTAPKGSL